MKRLVYFLLVMTFVIGIMFTACSTQSTTTPAAPATTQTATGAPVTGAQPTQATAKPAVTPRSGGILKQIHSLMVVNIGYIPDSSEPYDTWIAEADLEPLLAIQPDGNYGPCLATDWKVAPDYLSVVFTLRKGVKFHDGADFNAQAVKINLDLYNKGKLDNLRFVSSVDVVDDYTVKVNFGKTQSGFLLPFATRPGEMESPKALAEHPKEWFLQNTVGTGPFQIDQYVRDIKIDYKKFPGYWQPGKPYLDGIQWMFIADKTTSLMSYKSGEAQVLVYPSEKDRPDLEKAGVRIEKIAGPIFTCLMDGGNAASPFSKLQVRQAVAYAIDRQGMAQGLGYGYWVPLQQFSYEGKWGYDKDIAGYPYNVAKAKQLLTEAGYPNGFKTSIFGSSTTGYNELLQANLKDIGIMADISLGTMANVAEWRQKGWTNGLSITPAAGPGLYKDSRVGLAIFSSTSGSYPNIFHSQDMDDLITNSDKELNSDKKQEMYKQLNKLMVDTYCVAIPLFLNPGTLAISPDVGAWNFQNAQGAKFTAEEAWLKK
jgi:peptide/nickel transport system substrate-binding protein